MLYPSLLRFGFAIGALAGHGHAAPAHPNDDLTDTPLPIVVWHGLGDQFNSDGMKSIEELAEAINPGTFVHIISLDEDPNQDRSATFTGNVTDQISRVCEELSKHPILSTAPAIDAIGISQGGQFLRGYVERCNWPQVRSLVTFGSQHNGIVKFKACGQNDWLCKGAMALLRFNVWSSFVQSRLVPAQYYRDPSTEQDYNNYLENSNFLADINNERELKNTKYKANLGSLTNFVMWMFEDDNLVVPKESAWFEEVDGTESIPLRARKLYQEDWLGLRGLDRNGGLHFRSAPGDHLQGMEDLLNQTITDYFGPWKRSFSSPDIEFEEKDWTVEELWIDSDGVAMRETTAAEVHIKEERDLDPPTTTITTCVVSPVSNVDGDQESSLQPCDNEPPTTNSQSDSDDTRNYNVLNFLKTLFKDPDRIPKFMIEVEKSVNASCHCSNVEDGQIRCECDELDKNIGSKKTSLVAREPEEYPRGVICHCKRVDRDEVCECTY